MAYLRDQKRFCSRIGFVVTFFLLLCSGILTIQPIVRYSSAMRNGTCEISQLTWQKTRCDEGVGDSVEYYVPVISVDFYESLNLTDVEDQGINSTESDGITVSGLFINEHREDKTTKWKATIFDDGSESALIQCESPNLQYEINQLLAKHIPSLTADGSGFNESSHEPLIVTDYMDPFNCTYDSWKGVLYISYSVPNKLLMVTFYVALLLHFLTSFLILRNDYKDMIFCQLAYLSLCGVYLIHVALYIVFCIPLEFCGERIPSIPDFGYIFNKGSILFPLVWLAEKLFERCWECLCTTRPHNTPPTTTTANEVAMEARTPPTSPRDRMESPAPSPAINRRLSIESATSDPDSFPVESHPATPVPPSEPRSGPLFVRTDGLPSYDDVMRGNDGAIPPPPSYEEVMGQLH